MDKIERIPVRVFEERLNALVQHGVLQSGSAAELRRLRTDLATAVERAAQLEAEKAELQRLLDSRDGKYDFEDDIR